MATAKKAKGPVTFSGEPGTEIPRGTELVREDDTRFATTKKATIGESGEVETTAAALVAGEDGATEAESVLTLVEMIDGLEVEEEDGEKFQCAEVGEGGLTQGDVAKAAAKGPASLDQVAPGDAVLANYVVGGPRELTGQAGTCVRVHEGGAIDIEIPRPGLKPVNLCRVLARGDGPPFPGPTWELPAAEVEDPSGE